ncbi:hypothetical protein B0A48_16171 [Cryoendolithus antarcticus]|uniref:Uncharacterized protein n=1 Tax=Cryoendolithus antarcticus TaxID=1507870 RepID=A0A1V8SG87_9PEZI|nr:hypothetical protein B0A48_16171 [Cryoendolithus antarcticus]
MPEMAQRASSSATASPETDERDPHIPSSIPPWVHISSSDSTPFLPQPSRPNTRHYKPPPSHYKPGRKWDGYRTAEPALLSAPIAEHQVRWAGFMDSGPNPGVREEEGRSMGAQWMADNVPITTRAWEAEDEARADMPETLTGWWLFSPERQERTVRLFWRLLLKNPFIPLLFRLTCLAFAGASLGLAGTIYRAVYNVNHDAIADNQCATRASTYMALIVGAVAVPYIGYVTWDEYMSKPLGLRSAVAKTLLLLCDLYFIVFSASNLSLAFDALDDHRWACFDDGYDANVAGVGATCPNNPSICSRQRALSGVLLISLVAWLATFSVSVMRVVEKLR